MADPLLPSGPLGKPAIAVPVPMPISAAPTSTFWGRMSKWASENKALVYTAAGVAFVVTGAGVVYYLNSDSKSPPKLSKKERRKRKEAERKAAENSGIKEPLPPSATERLAELPEITEETVAHFSVEQREKYSGILKAAGNAIYAKKEYHHAIELYTKAILCNAREPVYHSNRAACYSALGSYQLAIEDCTAALSLNPEYHKARNRRAVAYENLGELHVALLEFTALCIMTDFSDESTVKSLEALLKRVAEQKAKEMMSKRHQKLPSYNFVGNYLQSFREKPRPAGLGDTVELPEGSGPAHLRLGLRSQGLMTREGYEAARTAFDDAIRIGDLGEFEALAYNMRGTYRYLMGQHEEAKNDFEASIEMDPTMTQSYIKRASMIVEQHQSSEQKEQFNKNAEAEFNKAIEQDPRDPDIYYHRAQSRFLRNEYAEAARDYQKSIDLESEFIYSHIQLGVSQYKMGSVASAMATFSRCVNNFPKVPDVYNYYGELLLDQGKVDKAIENFDMAFELERQTKPLAINVLPLINKALALFQFKNNALKAEELCNEALEFDPECDIAVATIAQLLLHQGKTTDALEYFEKAAELGRTEGETISALSYAEATRTQLEVQEKYPSLAAKLQGAASIVPQP